MSFCWNDMDFTSLSHECSCQCFEAFLVKFTAALSLQNLELLMSEGTFTEMSSSVRACINATLLSMTRISKSLQLASLAKRYLMKNVSGVPASRQVVPKSVCPELTNTESGHDSVTSPLINRNHVVGVFACWQFFHQFELIKIQHVSQLKLSASNASSGNFPVCAVW